MRFNLAHPHPLNQEGLWIMKMDNRGISLIEVLATIAIIVALAGIVVPAISFVKNDSKKAKTQAEITQLDTALMAFFTDNGSYPKTGQLLASLSDKYFNFAPERVDGGAYKDSFGEPYVYISPSQKSKKGYELYSMGMIMASASSSNITSDSDKDVVIGQPSGQGDKTIWGLSEPDYDILVKAALSLLRGTDEGYELAAMINIANVPIYWEDIAEDGELAYYYPYPDSESYGIYLDTSLLNGPAEAIAAILAHEATHLADHLASGDMDFDSIEEEYDAFYSEAMVWKQLKGNKTDATQDEILSIIKQGEDVARAWIRGNYPEWPEEDQWGDSYVVAKEY